MWLSKRKESNRNIGFWITQSRKEADGRNFGLLWKMGLYCRIWSLTLKLKWREISDRVSTYGKFWSLMAIIGFLPLFTFCSTGKAETGLASWYSTETCKINKHPDCPTASGKSLYALEKAKVKFAASWRYPLGTRLRVTNPRNGRSTVVRVEDRGPSKRLRRVIDLSKNAFSEIADPKKGLAKVKVEVMP